jgi:hypothetical protein
VPQYSGDNAPTVMMFLRKDHYLFAGDDGKRRLNGLKESYGYASTQGGSARLTIPFYLPHAIGLQDFKLGSGSSYITGDVYAQSCFALLIDNGTRADKHENLTVSSVSDAAWPPPSAIDKSSYYRCFIDTHIRNSSSLGVERVENCSFIRGEDGIRVPERTMIDEFFLTNGYGDHRLSAIPFKFGVSVASDEELGIDDEWGRIKEWARTKV